jgi:flagellar motility protein MotE (MotC chaperone)|mmetsp:Transcript_35926/g.81520  ORF Transcript_35926/g.81520 Transcript_35926/m.81520 type:complete len:135 (+) Transcript_35926:102-506(+)
MGKAVRKRRAKNVRFNPMACASTAQDRTLEGSQSESKPLSAHQARHLERKRLQAEVTELKRQRGKVSKGVAKHQHKAEKKALSKSLRAVKAQAVALKMDKLAPENSAFIEAPTTTTFAFDLPPPSAFAGGACTN